MGNRIEATARLSEHLTVGEVFNDAELVSPIQFYLARAMAIRLFEPARELIGGPLYVTNGERSLVQTESLEFRGYHPSRTSDHSFALPWFPFGVGAVDLMKASFKRSGDHQVMNLEHFNEDDFTRLRARFESSEYAELLGQLIWYRERGHIHLSNHKRVLFSGCAIEGMHIVIPARRFYIMEGE